MSVTALICCKQQVWEYNVNTLPFSTVKLTRNEQLTHYVDRLDKGYINTSSHFWDREDKNDNQLVLEIYITLIIGCNKNKNYRKSMEYI